MSVEIRDMHEDDLPAVADILNEEVRHTTAVWMDDPVDLADRSAWLAERRAHNFGALVADDAGLVKGYASYGLFRPFSGYARTAEHSIFIHREWRGAGIGNKLLGALIINARTRGMHTMIAAIGLPNDASIALHTKFGFREGGRFPEMATKFGVLRDLLLMQKMLSP